MEDAAKDLGMSLATLDSYLSAQVAGFAGATEVSKFGTGQSNPTYLVVADSG